MLDQIVRRFALSFLGLAALAGGVAQGSSILADGGFESPVIDPSNPYGALLQDFVGGSTIGPWTVLGSDVLLINTNYSEPGNGVLQFNAEEGQQSLDLTGAGNTGPTDGVSQVISTTIGQAYRISFYVGTASGYVPYYTVPATDDVSFGLGVIPSTNGHISPGPGIINWQEFSYDFVATASTTTIAFLNGTAPPTAEAGLDNVSVTALPLPSSALGGMVLLGVLGAAKVGRLLFHPA